MMRIFLPLLCAALGFAAASCAQSEAPPTPGAEAPASAHSPSHDAAAAAVASASDPAQADGSGQSASDADQTAPSVSQTADTPPDQAPSPEDSTATAASQSTTDASQDAPVAASSERRASTLIGMPVVSADGSSLGTVKDIVFDRQGRATHLVIAYGSEPPEPTPAAAPSDGEAEPSPEAMLTAMPWDAAMASVKDGRLVLDSAQLQAAPSFAPDAWPDLDDPAWSDATDAYWRKAVRAAIAAHPGAPIDPTSRRRARPTRGGN